VHNPGAWEEFWQGVRGRIIAALQSRVSRRLERTAF
jgi:hypothetical protein